MAPVFVVPGHGHDGERRQAPRPVGRHGLRRARPTRSRKRSSLGSVTSVCWREAQLVEGPRHREVPLVGDIDAGILQGRATRRAVQAAQLPQPHVARQRKGHEVGHHAARREQPEAPRSVADEVAQPAHDLLLHEGGRRTGVPHVHALLRELGQQLAHDGQQQWWWREVAERARVPRVELVGRHPVPELGQQVGRRRGLDRGRPRAAALPEEPGAQRHRRGRLAHGPSERLVVQVVERRRPRVVTESLQGGPGSRRVTDIDAAPARDASRSSPGRGLPA